MRLCADENVAEACVLRLRQAGHDVLWIRETAPGSSDVAVLARAQTEGRLLVTFDKDFGDLVFKQGAVASHGVVLFRIAQLSASAIAERMAAVIGSRNDWTDHYSVIEDYAIRMRPLPSE